MWATCSRRWSTWGLARRSESGLGLPERGFLDRAGELVAADEREDRREREQRDRSEHPERVLEAPGERRGHAAACVQQRVGVAGRDARGDRDPDRAAELLGGAQQSGSEPGLVL